MAVEQHVHGKNNGISHDLLVPIPEELQPPSTEGVIFDAGMEKKKRHLDNLSHLHGVFYKGTYYHNGVGQPHKK